MRLLTFMRTKWRNGLRTRAAPQDVSSLPGPQTLVAHPGRGTRPAAKRATAAMLAARRPPLPLPRPPGPSAAFRRRLRPRVRLRPPRQSARPSACAKHLRQRRRAMDTGEAAVGSVSRRGRARSPRMGPSGRSICGTLAMRSAPARTRSARWRCRRSRKWGRSRCSGDRAKLRRNGAWNGWMAPSHRAPAEAWAVQHSALPSNCGVENRDCLPHGVKAKIACQRFSGWGRETLASVLIRQDPSGFSITLGGPSMPPPPLFVQEAA